MTVLLREAIGDSLRRTRVSQSRTLREVSSSARVSLGYLSEVERGRKEASSELLAAICEALGAALSEVLRDVSDTLAHAEDLPRVLVPVGAPESGAPSEAAAPEPTPAPAEARLSRGAPKAKVSADAKLSVAVRHDGPLRTTLRATRNPREVVYAA